MMNYYGTVLVDSGRVAFLPTEHMSKWTRKGSGMLLCVLLSGRDEEIVAERCREIGFPFEHKGKILSAPITTKRKLRSFEVFANKLQNEDGLVFSWHPIRDNSYDRLMLNDSPVHLIDRGVSDRIAYVVSPISGSGEYPVYYFDLGIWVVFDDSSIASKTEQLDCLRVQSDSYWTLIDPSKINGRDNPFGSVIFRLTRGEYRIDHLLTNERESVGLRIFR
jgi:hypothetical protein